MKKALTLLLTLCLIVSVCALPVSAASISFNSTNIEVVNAAQGTIKVSGVLANDTPTENRYVTVIGLPSGITEYDGNTLAMSTAIVDLQGNFSATFAFNQPSGTYDFYVLYEGVPFGPAIYNLQSKASIAAVIRNIANGTTAKDNIISTIQNTAGIGIDLSRFPVGFERNLYVHRLDASRTEIVGATDVEIIESFYALTNKAEAEATFVKAFNNTTDVTSYVTLMKANATHLRGVSFTAYDSLGSAGKIYVQNSFVGRTFNNGDEIKAAFDTAVANAPADTGAGLGGPGGGGAGGGGAIVPEDNDREWSGEMEDNSNNTTSTTFVDLGSVAWASEAINALAAKGVVAGTSYGYFEPNGLVTREQFAKMLVLATGKYNSSAINEFTDIPAGDWSATYVASAKAAGFVNGVGEGKFGFGRSITREDMAVMIYNVMKSNGAVFEEAKTDFNDYAQISDYAKEAVSALAAKGIINGMGDNTFAPKSTATRAQAALLVYAITKGVA
ncbi:MAG: S-layer homology domain-containing protein [Clostridia bacterium]|nr:S-layer homology domain-containing protein [Clostridia bacterium]